MKKNKKATKISPVIGDIPMERVETRTLTLWMDEVGMRLFDEALKKEAAKGLWDKISKKGV